jgi:hypothetical protein
MKRTFLLRSAITLISSSLMIGCGTTVLVDNQPPTLSLTSSAINVVTAGTITLTATATDNVGVTKVEFYRGATKLGEDTTPADGFTRAVTLGAADNGTQTYRAVRQVPFRPDGPQGPRRREQPRAYRDVGVAAVQHRASLKRQEHEEGRAAALPSSCSDQLSFARPAPLSRS